MRSRILFLSLASLAASGACRDSSSSKPISNGVAPTATSAVHSSVPPALAPVAISNLDAAPVAARERLLDAVLSLEHDRRDSFLADVSVCCGFVVGTRGYSAEEVALQLTAQPVASLTELPCTAATPCDWTFAPIDRRRVAVTAAQGGRAVGGLELEIEDDGSWAVRSTHAVGPVATR